MKSLRTPNTAPVHALTPLSLLICALYTPTAWADDESRQHRATAARAVELDAITVRAAADDRTTEGTASYAGGATSTALGMPLSARETPQSVSVITRQLMDDAGQLTVSQTLENSAPGLSVSRSDSNRYQFSSRGFGISNFQFDGLPSPINSLWNFGATDMDTAFYDRVEVVRGATGLLSGAGDPSATVNFVRKMPREQAGGHAALTLGRWNLRRAEADLSLPLDSQGRVRGRVVAVQSDSDSYVSHFGQRRQGLYAVVSADLTPATRLVGRLEYQKNTSPGMGSGFPLFFADGRRTDFDRSVSNNTPWSHFGTENTTATLDLGHRLANRWLLRAAYSRNDGNYAMRYVYRGGAPDAATGLGMANSFIKYRGDRSRDSLHLTASGPVQLLGRQHEIALGWNHTRDDIDMRRYGPVGSVPATDNFLDWRRGGLAEPAWSDASNGGDHSRMRQSGGYAVGRFSLADGWTAVAGARVSHWSTRQDYFGSLRDYRYRNELTPYAGLLWDLDGQHTAYASYTEIFTPQNYRDQRGDILAPITGQAFELGLKGSWMQDRLQGAAAIFQTRQDNLAQDTGEFIDGTTDQKAYRGVKGARVRGIDLEISGEPAPGWRTGASYTHYTAHSASGAAFNTTHPRSLLKLTAMRSFGGPLQGLSLGGSLRWQSRIWQTVTNPLRQSVQVAQASYMVLNLSAHYRINATWSASAQLSNVLDRRYYSQIGFYNQGWWGEPRNLTLGLRADF
jgi:iron complex outermembrane receptor protein/outer membrane receptor for ferric coprogen and ferric-rhodotorulic acid